jgi:hypothetical protein
MYPLLADVGRIPEIGTSLGSEGVGARARGSARGVWRQAGGYAVCRAGGERIVFDQRRLEYELLEWCVLPPLSGSGSLLIARRQTRRPGRLTDAPRACNLRLSLAHLHPPPRPPHLAHAADDLDRLPLRWLYTHRLLRSLHARLDQSATHGDQGELGGHVDLKTSSSCSSSSLDAGGLLPPLVVGKAEGRERTRRAHGARAQAAARGRGQQRLPVLPVYPDCG